MQKSLLVSFLFIIAFQPLSLSAINSDSIESGLDNFRQIEASPTIFLAALPDKVNENSGLIFWRNALWTHNDSGGKPEIYKIDTASGKITQTIRLDGVKSFDWEDIAQDNEFIFVGEFGNNGGDRKDLCIYKIPKSHIPLHEKDVSIASEKIAFSYADQTDFENKFRRNNFDCEAFMAFGDSLYLFTKNWGDGNTRLYVLPKMAGQYQVSTRTTFLADGLITGVDINPEQTEIAFVGYKDFQSFIWLLWDFKGSDFFGGEKLRIDFPDLIFVQTEGITYINDDTILFSCEESAEPQSVFQVKSSELKVSTDLQRSSFRSPLIVLGEMPDFFSTKVHFDVLKLPNPHFLIELCDKRWGKIRSEKHQMIDLNAPYSINLPIEKLKPGMYFIKISSGNDTLVRKIKIQN